MSNKYCSDYVSVSAPGVAVDVTDASVAIPIPNAADGNKPRFIRIALIGNGVFIKLGAASVTATMSDLLVIPHETVIMSVSAGVTHFAVIQESGGSMAMVNVTPLEAS